MTQVRRKVNVYFFGEEQPAVSDQVTYYGTIIITGLITLVSVCGF